MKKLIKKAKTVTASATSKVSPDAPTTVAKKAKGTAKEEVKAPAKKLKVKTEEVDAKSGKKPSKTPKVSKTPASTKEAKYNYPEGKRDPMSKKKFRHEARIKAKRFERDMSAIKKKDSKEFLALAKEFKAFQKEYYCQ